MKYLTLLLLLPMTLHSSDFSHIPVKKVFDKSKHRGYYLECKKVKRSNCYTEAFNKSIVYKFVGE